MHRVGSDLTQPQAAALTFYKAIAECDAATARDASIGTDAQKRWITAMVDLIDGLERYRDALNSHFGIDALQERAQVNQSLLNLTGDRVLHLTHPIVNASDEAAVLYPAVGKLKLTAEPPVYLKKVKNQWKVDLTAMSDDPAQDPQVVARLEQAAQALHQVARDIDGGKYQTFAQVEAARP